jgi:acyl carrier protein
MDRHQDLVPLIVASLREYTEQQQLELPEYLSAETPLFGREGVLDSVGLVTVVVAVEQAIEDNFGVSVSLADEKAMSQTRSPFRTVGSLAEYARGLINK